MVKHPKNSRKNSQNTQKTVKTVKTAVLKVNTAVFLGVSVVLPVLFWLIYSNPFGTFSAVFRLFSM